MLSDLIEKQIDLMKCSQVPGGVARILADLFKLLYELPQFSPPLARLEEEVKANNRKALENLKECITWIKRSMQRVRKSSTRANDPAVLKCIKELEEGLQFKGYDPSKQTYLAFLLTQQTKLFKAIERTDVAGTHRKLYIIEYPSCISEALREYPQTEGSLRHWKEVLDSDPVILFGWLKNLSMYKDPGSFD